MDSINIINKIITKVQETQDDFIFTTIHPFCEGALQQRISKSELVTALLLYQQAKQILGVENEIQSNR